MRLIYREIHIKTDWQLRKRYYQSGTTFNPLQPWPQSPPNTQEL